MTFTKERLEEIAEDGFLKHGESKELARMALAGMEAEPVAYMYKDKLHADARFSLCTRFGNWSQEDINEYEITEIPLYAAPQPLTTSERAELENYRNAQQVVPGEKVIGTFNAEKNELALLDKNMTVERFAHWHVHNSLEVIVRDSRGAMLQGKADGNSPVIPDSWVMVPVDPTEDMIIQGFESEPDESFSEEKDWLTYEAMSGCQQAAHRAKLCWAAMIAASPACKEVYRQG